MILSTDGDDIAFNSVQLIVVPAQYWVWVFKFSSEMNLPDFPNLAPNTSIAAFPFVLPSLSRGMYVISCDSSFMKSYESWK